MAKICSSLNDWASDEPRWPLVPKLTFCSGFFGSGYSCVISAQQRGDTLKFFRRSKACRHRNGLQAYFTSIYPASIATKPKGRNNSVGRKMHKIKILRKKRLQDFSFYLPYFSRRSGGIGVDTPGSGSGFRSEVGVRLSPSAPIKVQNSP